MGWIDDNTSPTFKPINGAVEGVGASSVAIVDLPCNATYLELMLECSIAGAAPTRANLEAWLTNIRCTLDGKEQWSLTAKQLIAEVEFYQSGVIGDTGYIVIPFERLWMRNDVGATAPAWGTLGQPSFQLEITQSASSTIDRIQPWARLGAVAEELGAYIRTLRYTPAITAAGTFNYSSSSTPCTSRCRPWST